jgi:hypothetical protein
MATAFFDNAKLQKSVAKKSLKNPPKTVMQHFKSFLFWVV